MPEVAVRGEALVSDILLFLAVLIGWTVLQTVLLPRLGVPT